MAAIRDIQLCELDMLREIVRIAEKYDLRYSIAYGTFLGAVRHQGFIPWDDDLDITMPLRDLKKFEKLCKKELSEKYFLQTPRTDIAPFTFYKMRANNTIMPEDWIEGLNMHHGVWLDMFCYVHAAKSQWGRNIQWASMINLNRLRARHFHRDDKNPVRKIFARMPRLLMNLVDDAILLLIEGLGSEKSGMCFEMSGYEVQSEAFYSMDYLKNRRKWNFEGEMVYGPEDYDSYLKQHYGDNYMTPVRYGHIGDLSQVRIGIE